MTEAQKTTVQKYLQHYAEPEVIDAQHIFEPKNQDANHTNAESARYRCAMVIPCFDENGDFFARLVARHDMHDVLVIIVINQAHGSAYNARNVQLFEGLKHGADQHHTSGNVHLFTSSPCDCLVVDRFSTGLHIPLKQGVGLARKIGADIACQAFVDGITQSPWIYSTDADADLPDNYFSHCDLSAKECVAQVFNFAHYNDGSALALATAKYEQAIKYYRRGLQWAGSPYAFYTLGSTLAVSAWAYAQVRGFPKRAGGEDFYLLNKLAKVGHVQSCSNILIHLDARFSQRVPFGTGPAVQSILNKEQNAPYTYYHPAIFDELQQWLNWCTNILPERFIATPSNALPWHHESLLSKNIIDTAHSLAFTDFLTHATVQCRTPAMFVAHFHTWFDAFRTLKFVRILSSIAYPDLPLQQCVKAADAWPSSI